MTVYCFIKRQIIDRFVLSVTQSGFSFVMDSALIPLCIMDSDLSVKLHLQDVFVIQVD